MDSSEFTNSAQENSSFPLSSSLPAYPSCSSSVAKGQEEVTQSSPLGGEIPSPPSIPPSSHVHHKFFAHSHSPTPAHFSLSSLFAQLRSLLASLSLQNLSDSLRLSLLPFLRSLFLEHPLTPLAQCVNPNADRLFGFRKIILSAIVPALLLVSLVGFAFPLLLSYLLARIVGLAFVLGGLLPLLSYFLLFEVSGAAYILCMGVAQEALGLVLLGFPYAGTELILLALCIALMLRGMSRILTARHLLSFSDAQILASSTAPSYSVSISPVPSFSSASFPLPAFLSSHVGQDSPLRSLFLSRSPVHQSSGVISQRNDSTSSSNNPYNTSNSNNVYNDFSQAAPCPSNGSFSSLPSPSPSFSSFPLLFSSSLSDSSSLSLYAMLWSGVLTSLLSLSLLLSLALSSTPSAPSLLSSLLSFDSLYSSLCLCSVLLGWGGDEGENEERTREGERIDYGAGSNQNFC